MKDPAVAVGLISDKRAHVINAAYTAAEVATRLIKAGSRCDRCGGGVFIIHSVMMVMGGDDADDDDYGDDDDVCDDDDDVCMW